MKKLFGALLVAALMGSPLTAMADVTDEGVFDVDIAVADDSSECAQYGAVWDGDRGTCKFNEDACRAVGGSWVLKPNATQGVTLAFCDTAAYCNDSTAAWLAETNIMPAGTTARFDTNTNRCVYDNVIYTTGDFVKNFVEGFTNSDANCSEYGGSTDLWYGSTITGNDYIHAITHPAIMCEVNGTLDTNSGSGGGQTVNVGYLDPSIVGQGQCAQYGAVWNNNRCEFNETACRALQNSSWVDTDAFYFCDTAAFCANVTYLQAEMLFKDHIRFDTTINRCVIDDFVYIYGLGPQSVEGFTYSSANCAEYADGRNYAEGLVSSYSNQNRLDKAYLRCEVINSNSGNSGGTIGEAYIDPTIVNISDNCAQYGAVWDSENSRCKFDQTACALAGGRWWTNASGQGVCMTLASCRSPYRWDSTNKLCVVDGSIKDHGTGTFNTVNGFTYSSENCTAYTPGTGTTSQTIQNGNSGVDTTEPAVLTYCEVDDGSSASSPFRVSTLTPTEADGTIIASGAYAKGAYNANVGNINTALTYVEDSSVETIKHATVSAENVSLSVAGFTPAGTIDVDSSNATVSGTVNVANTVAMLSEWGTNSTENGTLSGSQQVSITNGAVTGMTGSFSGPASGQLSGTGSLSNASVHVNNWVPVNPS